MTYEISHQIKNVLLAEDNREHCFFFKRALKQLRLDISFASVQDGDALIKLLGSYIPDLLFLDLDMPCKNGVECIKQIRDNKVYDVLPIVIFTITNQHNAIQSAYGFGANLYFVKPQEFSVLVKSLEHILSLNWSDPKSITERYFKENKYVPFEMT